MEGIASIPTLPTNPPDLLERNPPSAAPIEPNLEVDMNCLKSHSPNSPTAQLAMPLPILLPPTSTAIHHPDLFLPITTPPVNIYEDQNQNRVKSDLKIEISNNTGDCQKPPINHTINMNTNKNSNNTATAIYGPEDYVYENSTKFFPSSGKDLELLKNIRKVYISRSENDTQCSYKVTDESGNGVFETIQGETDGSIWSRYFRQQQKIILLQDKFQHGILKLEFGRSRTVSCCQTLRFAAMTAHFKSKSEEPLCIIFKDRGCCIYSCCSSGVTYETVPQLDTVHPFTVRSKRQWKNRAEFMVKHSDGTILAFIDKEKKFYTLTMGENLKPTMKACLIGFLITMDIMDREDAGKLNCYLRPSTYVTILFLLMLFFMIGAFLFHFITAMVLAWPRTDRIGAAGCTDGVHVDHDPFLPPSNYTHSSEVNVTSAHDI